MRQLQIYLPRWMDALETEHPVKATLYEALLRQAETIGMLGQAETALQGLRELENILDLSIRGIDLGTGTVSCTISFPDSLFYEILSSKAGTEIENDAQLFTLLSDLVKMQSEYNKIADALASVKATGYGIVMPTADEMKLENPEIIRKNGTFGVKLKAGAPSIHMIRVDIDTEISPMVGDEKQSRDLIDHLTGESPENLWQSNIFGKSVYELIQEGLTAKLIRTPEDVRNKFRGSLSRIVNEGASGLICLIL
jgi:stage IV sporulation protein A